MEPLFTKIARHLPVREWLARHQEWVARHKRAELKRIGRFILAAIFASFVSFAISFVESGILNFPDNDIPPYQPDTPIEMVWDFFLFGFIIAAVLLWIWATLLFFRLCFDACFNKSARGLNGCHGKHPSDIPQI